MLKSGNFLFINWSATIFCSNAHINTIRINFSEINKDRTNIIGERLIEKETIKSINKTIEFLEKCHKEWIEHINEKRLKFSELNFFSTDQVAILRKELAKITSEKYHEKLIFSKLYNLIYNINDEVNTDCIRKTLASAYELSKTDDEMDSENGSQFGPLVDNYLRRENYPIERFNTLITDYEFEFGFSRRILIRVIMQLGKLDERAIRDYLISNEDQIQAEQEMTLDDILSGTVSNENELVKENSLKRNFETIWDKFKLVLNQNFEEFISINHLGYTLKTLKNNRRTTSLMQRPAYLDVGINLILCPQYEIITRTLSIYSTCKKLPQDGQILFCTNETTMNEIEVFCRRVIDKNKIQNAETIYCLVNVQELNYEKSIRTSAFIEELMSNMKQKIFVFCIICAIENEEQSPLVTAFNRFRVNIPNYGNKIVEDVKEYLKQGFKVDEIDANKSAARIEHEQLIARVISSKRAGCGKSLYVKRLFEKLQDNDKTARYFCLPIKTQSVSFESIFQQLNEIDKICMNKNNNINEPIPRIIHFDIAYEVLYNVDSFLFCLLCLNSLRGFDGNVWRRSKNDLFLIEIMTPEIIIKETDKIKETRPIHSIISILPNIDCLTPREILHLNDHHAIAPNRFDEKKLNSDRIQRTCQYLKKIKHSDNLVKFQYKSKGEKLDAKTCLGLLLNQSEIKDPSWAHLIYFAKFLNEQLENCEKSIYCNSNLLHPDFKSFAIKFMLQMSYDFALPSLEISDKSALEVDIEGKPKFELRKMSIRKKWEKNAHPYLLFNPDRVTFTFFGFNLDEKNGYLIDPNSKERIYNNISVPIDLIPILKKNVDVDSNLLQEDMLKINKIEKIAKILRIIGKNLNIEYLISDDYKIEFEKKHKQELLIPFKADPDTNYELTTDNVLKIIAIQMRFRTNIPVIIMGETGCG